MSRIARKARARQSIHRVGDSSTQVDMRAAD
jgi:hypothetical protein